MSVPAPALSWYPAARGVASRLADGAARHWLFLALLAVGAVLRVLTSIAYRPAMEFVQDSFDYLGDARELVPGVIRPLAYPLFLRAVSVTGRFGLVPVAQHLMALAMAVMLYALLRRLRVRPWLAALATAPLLLDGYQIYMEQFVLAETLFEFLVVSAFVALLWRKPTPALCAVAGALLALAGLTRTVGVVLLAPALGYLLVTRVGLRGVVSFVGAASLLLGGYAGWYKAAHGRWALQSFAGYFLAGRVAPFADCRDLAMPADERMLCDERPQGERPGPDWYVWNPGSPLRRLDFPPDIDRNELAASWARRIIRDQPGDYVRTVTRDFLHYFAPVRTSGPGDGPVQTFQFRTSFTPDRWQPAHPPRDPYIWQWTWPGDSVRYGNIVATHGFDLARAEPRLHPGIAAALRDYQRVGFTPGPLLVAAILAALVAGIGRVPEHLGGLRWSALLFAAAGVLMLLVPSATASFDFRYLIPALPVLPAAGALGVTLLVERRRASDRAHLPGGP
ncbi:MAG: hypothetical protein M3203_10575, partial [Actinomycetota bacterium]|nr:hypothetical protein [Actinomycetota bacterium]